MAAPSERIAAGAQAACLPVYLADGENCLADEKTPAENEQKMWREKVSENVP